MSASDPDVGIVVAGEAGTGSCTVVRGVGNGADDITGFVEFERKPHRSGGGLTCSQLTGLPASPALTSYSSVHSILAESQGHTGIVWPLPAARLDRETVTGSAESSDRAVVSVCG